MLLLYIGLKMFLFHEPQCCNKSQWQGCGIIKLFVHRQVNSQNQNPHVKPDLLVQKLTFFLSLEENICCWYQVEAPQHLFFFSINKKKKYIYIYIIIYIYIYIIS